MKELLQPAFYRYVRYLPPKMVFGKLKHALVSRVFVPRAVKAIPPPDYDWSGVFSDPQLAAFASVFRVHGERFSQTCEKLVDGEFVSNGVPFCFGSPDSMQWGETLFTPQYPRWQHDLSYFFYAIPLAADNPDRGLPAIAAMVRALDRQLDSGRGELKQFHWKPIAIASRTMALATALALTRKEALREHADSVEVIGKHLWRCTAVLQLTVERYLGFNHAAITEAGFVLGLLVRGRNIDANENISALVATLEAHTLSDGMWAERSPAYHLHMLVLAQAFQAMVDTTSDNYRRLDALVRRMRHAMNAVVHPDGEIAVLNDAAVADAPAPSSIGWSAAEAPRDVVLPAAGYARISRGSTVVIMDAGPMGPDAVIGHGHADFLSIEVSVRGRRLIVDPGVASVSSDSDRQWTRSAASHNGPTLKGREPAEFFGAWRVGRRGTAWFNDIKTDPLGSASLSGECDGYVPWGVMVSRRIVLDIDGELTIDDQWLGDSDCCASVSFLLPTDWSVVSQSARVVEIRHSDGNSASLRVSTGATIDLQTSRYFLTGPMGEAPATRLLITPSGKTLTTVISPRVCQPDASIGQDQVLHET